MYGGLSTPMHFDQRTCIFSLPCSMDAMDLHKIIHGALNEFIHQYIPDADLR